MSKWVISRVLVRLFIFILFITGCTDKVTPVLDEPTPYFCEQSECWNEQYYVCRDSTYNNFFTRTFEWTGGDATYSVELGNNKRLWMFGDTFIDQVNSDGTRPSFRLINNSLVLEDAGEFTTYFSGSRNSPESYAKPAEESWWYWPGDATLVNDTLYLFMHGFGNDLGGAWDFYRTSIDLLKINPATLGVYENVRLFATPYISWGAAILEDDDYTYVYGARVEGFNKGGYVARTNTTLSEPWQYYNGTTWVDQESEATAIFNNVSEQFSVFKQDGQYYMLSQQNSFGYEIFLHSLANPYSAVLNSKVVYCTPESTGDLFTYNALAHPNVYSDSLLISYNLNSFDFKDLLDDVNNYRPYFVRVGNWQN